MPNTRPWLTDVNFLMVNFRDALKALAPIVERVSMPWKNPDNYDDWDSICSSIFKAIVLGTIDNASEFNGYYRVLDYDIRVENYSMNSFLIDKGDNHSAFVCLETETQPFDTCLFAKIGKDGEVLQLHSKYFDEVEFNLFAKNKKGDIIINNINVFL